MKLFGPKRKEVTETERDFINKSFMICISHRDIFRVIKSSIIRRQQHVAHSGRGKNAYRIWVGKLEEKTKAWNT
jgi:hypothetical protein